MGMCSEVQSIAPLKKECAYPSEDISIRIARRRGDTYNSASSWAKSAMMNIVDNGRKFSWRVNGIVSAVRRSLACGSGPTVTRESLLAARFHPLSKNQPALWP